MKLIYLINIIVCAFARDLNIDLETDYTVNDCLTLNNKLKDKYFGVDINGYPYCAQYTKNDDERKCNPGDENPCEPGFICGKSEICEINTTSCFKYYANGNVNKNILELLWTPDCTEDGSWTPKQCKAVPTGRCFCYDSKGHRLFGDAFHEESADMTCACSKRKAELLDSSNPHRRTYVSFHCDQKGNFEELQCDSAHCWCADPKTGAPTSVIVPENTMTFLNCFKKLKGDQYLRKCESVAYAQAKTIEMMKRRGIVSPNIKPIKCEDDGSYGPYTTENSIVYCVTKTNSKMTYYSEISENEPVDCNCGRDQEMYKNLGKSFNLKCDNNGNYNTFQTNDASGTGFCVDRDGNKLVDGKENESDCKIFNDFL